MKRVLKKISIAMFTTCLLALLAAISASPAHAQTDEITYGFIQDPANPLAITVVAYPDFTSSDVTISTAQVTLLLPEGTATTPSIPDAPTAGSFTNLNGTWRVLKLTPTLWNGIGQNAADLEGYDLYQVTLQNSPSVSANAGGGIPLFSFELAADCTTQDVRVLVNDEAIQQSVLSIFGNVNNQMSVSVDGVPAVDSYTGNDALRSVLPCPLEQQRIYYGLVQDPGDSDLVTAVAYPNFTSSDVTMTTAQFTLLLPEGTTTTPTIPNAPTAGAFTDITGAWDMLKLTPSAWAGGGGNAADLAGYDLYQATLQSSPEITVNAWDPISLFSFRLPDGCSGHLRLLNNDEPIQQAVLSTFGNVNNQHSMSVDNVPAVDIYVSNHAPAASISCPLEERYIYYGLVQDPADPNLVTAVAYPDFTSNDVTMTTAQFTFLLPEGTTTTPTIPDAPTVGAFTDITGAWNILKLTPSAWASSGGNAADLAGYDLYQATIQTSPEVTATAWSPISLFSFRLPNDCNGDNLRMLDNDEAIQQAILATFGNVNNQHSMSVDNDPSVDIYVDNHDPARTITCPLASQTPSIVIEKLLNTPDPVLPGHTITFTIRITNTGTTTITTLPLTDTYSAAHLTYVGIRTSPASDTTGDTGQILWSDLTQAGPNGFGRDLGPNDSFEIIVEFSAAADTSSLSGTATTNMAQSMGQTASDTVRIYAPTNVNFASKEAIETDDGMTLRWTTLSEADMIGFTLWLSINGNEPAQISPEIIAAEHSGQNQGATYTFLHEGVQPKTDQTYLYIIEIIEAEGITSRLVLGQITPTDIFLPVVVK